MPQVIVGRWGKSLAVRVPADVARAAGLQDGEAVELETKDGNIIMRPQISAEARERARRAADEIIEARKGLILGMDWRELRDEGRRG